MKPWLEKISLGKPLTDVRLAAPAYPADLEKRIQERERAAFERGREAGEKALGVQLVQQRSDLLALHNGVLTSLRQCIAQTSQECEGALVALALEVAQKLVAGLPVSVEMVEAAIKEALAQVKDTNDFVVFLNPLDHDLLKRVNSPMMQEAATSDRMRLESSSEVTPGGCIVQTRVGTVNACREAKFELLTKSLHN